MKPTVLSGIFRGPQLFARGITVNRLAKIVVAAATTLCVGACSEGVVHGPENGEGEPDPPDGDTYSNPVLNRDFPDPTVIEGPDGWYYAYATETMIAAQPYNIQVARSQDLVHWTWEGDALPDGVEWAAQGRSYWAPHVLYDADLQTYFMYFSAHHDVRNGKCLAVATSEDPLGPFESTGEPLRCGEGFVEIDPMAFDDPVSGKKLLYWGSGFEPIRVQEMSDDRLRFRDGSEPHPLVYPGRDASYSNLVEGAWVIHRDSTYYLFYSGDNCCGDAAHYAVMVARSSDPLGPFERLGEADGTGHSVILEADATWLGPGHNSVVRDAEGNDWIFYHAIDRSQPRRDIGVPGVQWDRRVMLMERIMYLSGWPRIEGRRPSETAAAPVVASAVDGAAAWALERDAASTYHWVAELTDERVAEATTAPDAEPTDERIAEPTTALGAESTDSRRAASTQEGTAASTHERAAASAGG